MFDQILEERARLLEQGLTRDEVQAELLKRYPAELVQTCDLVEDLLIRPNPQPSQSMEADLEVPNYRILRRIEEGGMGVVYEAIRLNVGDRVAIKVINPEKSSLSRFEQERQTLARLNHANIVRILDEGSYEARIGPGQTQTRRFIAMEYCPNGTLKARIKDHPQDPRWAAELVLKLARGMAVCHALDPPVVHRDLKPSNILFDNQNEPKIADFGLARFLDGSPGLTEADQRVGTYDYMSPEQAMGRPEAVTTATDVYGLGAILYEMLTARPPFQGASPLDTLEEVKSERDPLPPRRLVPKIPRDLEMICLTCLRRFMNDRYSCAEELANDLQRFLSGDPVQARPLPLSVRAVRWCARRPAIVLAWILAMAIIGGIAWKLERGQALARTIREGLDQAKSLRSRTANSATGQLLVQEQALSQIKKVQSLLQVGWAGWRDRSLRDEQQILLKEIERTTTDTRDRVARQVRDQAVHDQLGAIQLERAVTTADAQLNYAKAAASYQRLFAEVFQIDLAVSRSEAELRGFADALRATSITDELTAGLWDFALSQTLANLLRGRFNQTLPQQARKLAALVDSPSPERTRVHQALTSPMAAFQIAGVAESLNVATEPTILLGLVGEIVGDFQPARAIAFLRRAQRVHPDDFWINHFLALELSEANPADWAEVLRYRSVTAALKPGSPLVHELLAQTLDKLKRPDEAELEREIARTLKLKLLARSSASGKVAASHSKAN